MLSSRDDGARSSRLEVHHRNELLTNRQHKIDEREPERTVARFKCSAERITVLRIPSLRRMLFVKLRDWPDNPIDVRSSNVWPTVQRVDLDRRLLPAGLAQSDDRWGKTGRIGFHRMEGECLQAASQIEACQYMVRLERPHEIDTEVGLEFGIEADAGVDPLRENDCATVELPMDV